MDRLTGAAEADVVMARAEVAREIAAALRGGDLFCRRIMSPSPRPAHGTGS